MLMRRWQEGVRLEEPVFCDALGRFRDPNNVRRDLRRARAPMASEARQQLGVALMRARRAARRSRQDVAEALTWPRTRVELLETGRVRLDVDDVIALADQYGITGGERAQLLAVAAEAAQRSDRDALTWITSNSFRKTTATILDDAGESARQIADQLGHARPSLTQDVYMGRRAKNPAAAQALEQAMREHPMEPKPGGLPGESRDRTADPTR
jgi:transcriptional regulator with XRE-family HTH domain